MIKISIAENETKVKGIITQMLRQEGYTVLENEAENNEISVVKQRDYSDLSMLRDIVVGLQDSLYDEKRGVLYKAVLEVIEKPIIERALERTEGNQLKAAKILGINRNTMRAKIKKLGINPDSYKY